MVACCECQSLRKLATNFDWRQALALVGCWTTGPALEIFGTDQGENPLAGRATESQEKNSLALTMTIQCLHHLPDRTLGPTPFLLLFHRCLGKQAEVAGRTEKILAPGAQSITKKIMFIDCQINVCSGWISCISKGCSLYNFHLSNEWPITEVCNWPQEIPGSREEN